MTTYFRQIPNIITVARMVAMVPLVWLMWHKEYKVALIVALLAGASDGLDGYLAKKFNWQGRLGSILDPLADKLMMLCCYTVFVLQGVIPSWLYAIIVIRDIVIVAGTTFYNFKIGRLDEARPSMVSKVNTALQILLILVLLITLSAWYDLSVLHWPLIWAVAFLGLVSGVHYVWLGLNMAKVEKQKKELIDDQ